MGSNGRARGQLTSWFARELRRNPTLLGLDKLLEAALLTAPAEQRHDIDLVKQLIHGHTRRVARYRCDACGFKARQFYWRCPACGGWETYPPKRTEEFDISPETAPLLFSGRESGDGTCRGNCGRWPFGRRALFADHRQLRQPTGSVMEYKTLEDYVGHTPLVRLKRIEAGPGCVLLAKLEGNNPAGSVKDRPALSMIMRAEERGEIRPGTP